MKHIVPTTILYCLLLVAALPARGQEEDTADAKKVRLKQAHEHMQQMEMRLAGGGDPVDLIDHPLLTYGDSARSNENGTLWAWGTSGRPLALLELYQPTGGATNWVHAITLTSTHKVAMKTPVAAAWTPKETQINPEKFPDAPSPSDKEATRARQLKELARRFTAHEFWDPDNSRFELRLLVQPVHRYSDSEFGIHDGAVFVLAHGTNPEVLLLIEALGKSLEEARWHYNLARLGSAELHVELDEKEVWKQNRTPGVVGKSTDPYWLFLSPARERDR